MTRPSPLSVATRPGSLSNEAYARLEELIITLQLPPGEAVSEAMLSDMLGIGRTPVREALQRLVREGLIVVLPQRGTLVSEIDVAMQLRAVEVRREVERLIVTLAARRGTVEERKAFATLGRFASRRRQRQRRVPELPTPSAIRSSCVLIGSSTSFA